MAILSVSGPLKCKIFHTFHQVHLRCYIEGWYQVCKHISNDHIVNIHLKNTIKITMSQGIHVHIFLLIDWVFVVFVPFKNMLWHLKHLGEEEIFIVQYRVEMGPWFTRSHLMDRPVLWPLSTSQGYWGPIFIWIYTGFFLKRKIEDTLKWLLPLPCYQTGCQKYL